MIVPPGLSVPDCSASSIIDERDPVLDRGAGIGALRLDPDLGVAEQAVDADVRRVADRFEDIGGLHGWSPWLNRLGWHNVTDLSRCPGRADGRRMRCGRRSGGRRPNGARAALRRDRRRRSIPRGATFSRRWSAREEAAWLFEKLDALFAEGRRSVRACRSGRSARRSRSFAMTKAGISGCGTRMPGIDCDRAAPDLGLGRALRAERL